MKAKLFLLGLAILILSFCAASNPDLVFTTETGLVVQAKTVAQISFSFDNYTFDEVWKGCMEAISDRRITVRVFNRENGQIFGSGGTSKKDVTFTEEPSNYFVRNEIIFYFMISESNGKVTFIGKAGKYRPAKDPFNQGKKELDFFLSALKKNLKK